MQPDINPVTQLTVHFRGESIKLPIDVITLFKGHGNYTYIYTCDGMKYLICKTLKSLSVIFGNKVIRVHKSFLVNPHYVVGFEDDDRHLKMRCGNTAAVSKRKKKQIADFFETELQEV